MLPPTPLLRGPLRPPFLHTSQGFLLKNSGDMFKLLFMSAREALGYCMAVQEGLMRQDWDETLLAEHPEFQVRTVAYGKPPQQVVSDRGPRVRMAIQSVERDEQLEVEYDLDHQLVDVRGQYAQECGAILNISVGGEILMSTLTWRMTRNQPEARATQLPESRKRWAGVKLEQTIYQVCAPPDTNPSKQRAWQ